MKTLTKIFLAAMMLPLTGCGTLMTLDQPVVYSGVQEDVSRLTFSKTVPAGDVGEAFGTILKRSPIDSRSSGVRKQEKNSSNRSSFTATLSKSIKSCHSFASR